MNSNRNSSELKVLVDKELEKFLEQYRLDDLAIVYPNTHTEDISDMQLEHALALGELLQEQVLESEVV